MALLPLARDAGQWEQEDQLGLLIGDKQRTI
jgi:hypothetical protein